MLIFLSIIAYGAIGFIIAAITEKYFNFSEIDSCNAGCCWPFFVILFCPILVYKRLSDVWYNNLSKAAKQYKKENDRKTVEEALSDIWR